MKTNRVCKICGKAYYYCVSCDEAQRGQDGYEPWHILVHDHNCLQIFTTLQNHFTKDITDEQAREKLNACDLSVVETATKSVKEQVENILRTEAKEEASTPKIKVEKPVRKAKVKKVNVEN